jgi:phosphohistidine phosphatase
MALHLRKAEIRPELVLCSSATRAVQTYEALSTVLGQPVVVSVEEALYGATDTDLLVRLHEVPGTVGAVLLVGHNPGLQDLALGLADDGNGTDLARLGDKFPTCALAILDIPTAWDALGPGHAYLKSLVLPRDLPD